MKQSSEFFREPVLSHYRPMKSASKFNKEAAGRVAAIGALATFLYTYLMPISKGSTLLGIPNLPLNHYPILASLLAAWVIAGLFAGIQLYGVPRVASPVLRSLESLFFWVAPALLAYMILFVGVAINVPFVMTNFVLPFAIGFDSIAAGFGIYFALKITRDPAVKAAIERLVGKRNTRTVTISPKVPPD